MLGSASVTLHVLTFTDDECSSAGPFTASPGLPVPSQSRVPLCSWANVLLLWEEAGFPLLSAQLPDSTHPVVEDPCDSVQMQLAYRRGLPPSF